MNPRILSAFALIALPTFVLAASTPINPLIPESVTATDQAIVSSKIDTKKWYDCQPKLFDPATAKYRKVENGGSPSELYELTGKDIDGITQTYDMQINGWNKQDEQLITLKAPYTFTYYQFGCASSLSSVIEIKKSGKRLALYTHVSHFAVSPDRTMLYLASAIQQPNGTWQDTRRIITIATKKAVTIPTSLCNQDRSVWSAKRLVTTGVSFNSADTNEQMCIWDASGKLAGKLKTNLRENNGWIADLIGLLPNDPDIVYALQVNYDTNLCSLYLQHLTDAKIHRAIPAFTESSFATCALGYVELDLNNLKRDSGSFKYRLKNNDGSWNPWIEVKK